MIDLFVKENEEIKIEIVVGVNKEGNILCEAEKDLKEIKDVIIGEIEEYFIIFKKPNFKDTSEISGDSISIDANSGVSFNLLEVRMNKIKKLLKNWNLKNSDGNIMPAIEENVEKLHPAIAATIGTELDVATGGAIQ